MQLLMFVFWGHAADTRKVYKSGKADATTTKGIMGSHIFSFLDQSSRCFSSMEGKTMKTCINAFFFHRGETPWISIN